MGGRLHPGRLRMLPGDGQALRSGRLGPVRLLRVALAVLLGAVCPHLVCALGGLPFLFALTGAKADERETLRDLLDTAADVVASHPRQTRIGGGLLTEGLDLAVRSDAPFLERVGRGTALFR